MAAGLLGRRLRLPVGWAVVGAALPDLLDKPLASLGVVDLFHSVGHSALLAVVVLPIAFVGRAGVAAALGWSLHLFLDAFHVIVNGRAGDALFLLWPLAIPPDPLAIPPGEFVFYYLWSPSFFVEVAIWAGAAALALRAVHERTAAA
nr:metal-dependent hydrolase [Halobellus ruber]